MKFSYLLSILSIMLVVFACRQTPDYLPKPRIYPKVEYPVKAYKSFTTEYCQFSFQQPNYAVIEQDRDFLQETPLDPCWFDIVFPQFAGRIHCSYSPIGNEKDLYEAINDAYTLANKHNVKADYIDELVISNPQRNVHGVIFDMEGSTASPFQFYITDSVSHYLRGSLYFNTSPEPDSMRPVIEFVKEDLAQMLNTFEWNK